MDHFHSTLPDRQTYRLKNWNYGSCGNYFITICVKNSTSEFGEFVDSKFVPSILCQYATECWESIPNFHAYIEIDSFIFMPDHMHGILRIKESSPVKKTLNQFGPPQETLAKPIRGFKSAVKSFALKNDIKFTWQSRYYDSILHEEANLLRVRKYIMNNQKKSIDNRDA